MFKFGKYVWQIGFHPSGVFGARDACDADGLQLRVLFKDVMRGGLHEHTMVGTPAKLNTSMTAVEPVKSSP